MKKLILFFFLFISFVDLNTHYALKSKKNIQIKKTAYRNQSRTKNKTDTNLIAKSAGLNFESEISWFEKDQADQLALQQLEGMKINSEIRELLEEITFELERDPDLINFESFSKGLMVELDEKFYERMIPNKKFRRKWKTLIYKLTKISN